MRDQLSEWGRWARQDSNPGGYQLSSLWVEWIPAQWWKDAGEDPPPAIENRESDPNDAECFALDREIRHLDGLYRRLLVIRYVQQQFVDELRLGAAERALQDRL